VTLDALEDDQVLHEAFGNVASNALLAFTERRDAEEQRVLQ
jgi:hypothetical protein